MTLCPVCNLPESGPGASFCSWLHHISAARVVLRFQGLSQDQINDLVLAANKVFQDADADKWRIDTEEM